MQGRSCGAVYALVIFGLWDMSSYHAHELQSSGLLLQRVVRQLARPREMAALARAYFEVANSGFFVPQWYREHYPDVAARGGSPLLHFLRHGIYEGRNPSGFFDVAAYLRANPDVRRSRLNPLLHFLRAGRAALRSPVALQNPFCNICFNRTFLPGPGGRMSASGLPPRCRQCDSLERHRALRRTGIGCRGRCGRRRRFYSSAPIPASMGLGLEVMKYRHTAERIPWTFRTSIVRRAHTIS